MLQNRVCRQDALGQRYISVCVDIYICLYVCVCVWVCLTISSQYVIYIIALAFLTFQFLTYVIILKPIMFSLLMGHSASWQHHGCVIVMIKKKNYLHYSWPFFSLFISFFCCVLGFFICYIFFFIFFCFVFFCPLLFLDFNFVCLCICFLVCQIPPEILLELDMKP